MTLEYRCSNCGTLLQTTNADPLHDEIERLRHDNGALIAQHSNMCQEMDRLQSQLDSEYVIPLDASNLEYITLIRMASCLERHGWTCKQPPLKRQP